MSPETKSKLEKFCQNTKWGSSGDLPNMQTFWDYVIAAYHNNDRCISLQDFLKVINEYSELETDDLQIKKKILASKMYLFTKYEDGMKLLGKFDHQDD